ncbi:MULTISPECIES: hypothetical protein [Nostoc]|uniref:Uncharacterized protein n=1 Tax=Nostoc paludosum FACHB-159 TaxID=2692908 RepID=A0ABR8KNE0_9NOSO|nr:MULTISPECIES: hypothetical protein [Nostoc]MBD2683076.1 hypothetical protein [Nostoc sp. FACHB-857]MBD2739418.1 hypothetical protein [Nostoc paludosum FACHB-159]
MQIAVTAINSVQLLLTANSSQMVAIGHLGVEVKIASNPYGECNRTTFTLWDDCCCWGFFIKIDNTAMLQTYFKQPLQNFL